MDQKTTIAIASATLATIVTHKLHTRKLKKIESAHALELVRETSKYHSSGFQAGKEFGIAQEKKFNEIPSLRPTE